MRTKYFHKKSFNQIFFLTKLQSFTDFWRWSTIGKQVHFSMANDLEHSLPFLFTEILTPLWVNEQNSNLLSYYVSQDKLREMCCFHLSDETQMWWMKCQSIIINATANSLLILLDIWCTKLRKIISALHLLLSCFFSILAI